MFNMASQTAKVEFTDDEKITPLKQFVESVNNKLQGLSVSFTMLASQLNELDKVIYQHYFTLKDQFNKISKIYDLQLQQQQQMSQISQEQLGLYNQLQEQKINDSENKYLYDALLKCEQTREFLEQQVLQDRDLYSQIQDMGLVLQDMQQFVQQSK